MCKSEQMSAMYPIVPGRDGPVRVCLVRPSPVGHDRVPDQQAEHQHQQPPLPHDRSTQHCDRPHQAAARCRNWPWGRVETPVSRLNKGIGRERNGSPAASADLILCIM